MEIVRQRSGDVLELRVSGRLDNHWSGPFEEALAEIVREGIHHVRVDLTAVNYLSSAGIGALMIGYNEMQALQGSFVVTAASDRVLSILQMVGLESILFATSQVATAEPDRALPKQIQSESALFESWTLDARPSTLHLSGRPDILTERAYAAGDAGSLTAASDRYALGVGALGHGFDECRNLFGEFVVAGGIAASMPTDGTTTPDYMMTSGDLVPEMQTLYAIEFRGAPAALLRFESSTTGGGTPLSEIVRVCSTIANTPSFGVVIAAEVSGLVCTRLRRSPAVDDSARFEFPAIREWLSFASEHEFARSSSLVVGIASSSPSAAIAPFVRPLHDSFAGHFHAVVTAFRSIPRGSVAIADVLQQSFQPRSILSVVHLLTDNRSIEGAGESEFQRGACWIFPLGGIS
jgi:anti-sigma B factor antagonist